MCFTAYSTAVVLMLLTCTGCAIGTPHEPQQSYDGQQHPVGLQYSRDFGVSSFIFSGSWSGRPYQATIHTRAVCQDSNKHMRLVISVATAPHPYYQNERHYEHAVTPAGWFSFDNGMPKIIFKDYTSGEEVVAKQHVGEEREVDGAWFFDDEWITVCWSGTANLKRDAPYTLSIEGSERSYQAVAPGPCPEVHPMFLQQLPFLNGATNTLQHMEDGNSSSPSSSPCSTNNQPTADNTTPLVWMAPVQKIVFATTHMAYIVLQHLEYHMRLGMAGMLLTCDYFVCLELLQDPALARRANEARLVLWVWEQGNEYDKPYNKQYTAINLMRMAAYGTNALLVFQDLDEFMVLPTGKPLQLLLAPGGCLDGVRQHSQVTVRSKVAVATNWQDRDHNTEGELPAWLAHDLWVDALAAMNYSMAPQAVCGWKTIADPNSDYNYLCHNYFERDGTMDDGMWSNYADYSCAYNMHFTNWFSNRLSVTTVGGILGDFVPLHESEIDQMRNVYHSRALEQTTWSCSTTVDIQPRLESGQTNQHVSATHAFLIEGEKLLPNALLLHSPVQHAMKTISVTLVTRTADILIGRALRSVSPLVDACLVVYSSALEAPEKTLAAAADAVGYKLATRKIPASDLESMLNGSLVIARQLGAEWAILVGPDQQVLDDSGLQQAVTDAVGSGIPQHNCHHIRLEYSQAFLVQLSTGGGYVHDQYVQPHGYGETNLHGCAVTRPVKVEQWKQRHARAAVKAVRGRHASTEMPQAGWFVLAEAHWVLQQRDDALTAWQQCSALQQSKELGGLCSSRLALMTAVPGSDRS